MTRVHFDAAGDEGWGEFPPCPYCGEDAVGITADWGYDPLDGFAGYEVDCDACGQDLGRCSFPEDIERLVKHEWPELVASTTKIMDKVKAEIDRKWNRLAAFGYTPDNVIVDRFNVGGYSSFPGIRARVRSVDGVFRCEGNIHRTYEENLLSALRTAVAKVESVDDANH